MVKRRVTSGEREMLYGVFQGALNCELITVLNYAPDDPDNKRSFEAENRVHLLGGDYAPDLSKVSSMSQKATFVHECAHAWQYQCTGYESTQIERDVRFEIMSYETLLEIERIEGAIDSKCTSYSSSPREQDLAATAVRQYYRDTLDSLNGVVATSKANYRADKKGYVAQHAYDPIIGIEGPLGKYESRQTPFPRSKTTDILLERMMSEAKPKLGERLSDFLWRTAGPRITGAIESKEQLKANMKNWAQEDDGSGSDLPDYNYMLRKPGTVDFIDLRTEAQAQMIEDYFLIKSGVDPRSVKLGGGVLFTRPPLAFYEDMIPFVSIVRKPDWRQKSDWRN